jgi:membrane protease YdiL (CAAX protease family)
MLDLAGVRGDTVADAVGVDIAGWVVVLVFARAWGPVTAGALRLRPPRVPSGLAWTALALIAMVAGTYLAFLTLPASTGGWPPDAFDAWPAVLAAVLIAPVAEQLITCGFCLRALESRFHPALAAVFVGLLFAVPHVLGGYDGRAGAQVFLDGVVFAGLTLKTDSIWPGVFLHALRNLVAVA